MVGYIVWKVHECKRQYLGDLDCNTSLGLSAAAVILHHYVLSGWLQVGWFVKTLDSSVFAQDETTFAQVNHCTNDLKRLRPSHMVSDTMRHLSNHFPRAASQ